ncbi:MULTISPECIES: EamA family transporter [unclassified Leptolyngbya]|uniref:DMT family transporter n=1 Tax=unclassified Leptolyngbya TaxID=2650499 RepID=UPI001684149A|nr:MULTISPECIES: EamA family transporter [unclassified Leptolyngbya]MBD1912994.1 EamA family transporter [Leptolyngbya sp. FACHB-8]MBD2155695.1 EamA family transporter [Leptolyngbya sp. FACHB-16]
MALKLSESRIPVASLLLIAPFFLWGTAMVAMKGVILQTTPLFMAGIRLVPAGLLILVATQWMGRPQPSGWRAWAWISLFGLIDGALFQGFLAEGLVRTGAGLGSVMIDSQPLAVALMARFLFGEQVRLWGWLGLAFGVAGISLLGLPEAVLSGLLHGQLSLGSGVDLVERIFQNGQWLMLLAALSMAVGTVLMRYVSRHADPVAATGWHMILGGIPLFVLSAWGEVGQWQQLGLSEWTAMAYSTVFGSAIAYGLFFYFAATGSLTSLVSLTFLTPVFALLFGNWLLGEVLNLTQWFGVGLTLVSIYLINQRDRLSEIVFGRSSTEAQVEGDGEAIALVSTTTTNVPSEAESS